MPRLRKENITAEHGELGRSALQWREDRAGAPLRRYGLRYAAYHLRWAGEHERLWEMLSDQGYQAEQTRVFRGWVGPAVSSLREGIEVYAERGGQVDEDDARLCRLLLRCGEVVQEAATGISTVFEVFRNRPLEAPERIEHAAERLQILDESEFGLAGLLLIYIDCARSREAAVAVSVNRVTQLVKAMEIKAPQCSLMEAEMNWTERTLAELLPPALFLWVGRTSRTFNYSQAVEVYLSQQNWPAVFEAAKQIECESRRAMALAALGAELARAERVQQSDEVFGEATRSALRSTELANQVEALAFIAAKLSHAKSGREAHEAFQRAENIVERMPAPETRAVALALLGKQFSAAGETERAASVFHLALSLSREIQDPRKKFEVLGKIATSLEKAGDGPGAARAFGEARAMLASFSTGADSCRTTTDAIAQAMEFSAANGRSAAVFARALDALIEAETAIDSSAVYGAAGVLAQAQQFETAQSLARGLKAGYEQVKALGEVAACLAQAGQMNQARGLLDEALEASRVIDSRELRYSALAGTAGRLGEAGELDWALEAPSRLSRPQANGGEA